MIFSSLSAHFPCAAPARAKGMGRFEMGDGSRSESEFKYYRLTDKGREQLLVEESQWKRMAEAVARVMWLAAEES
jgi:DNA-binding PadR family transcriptional regulator